MRIDLSATDAGFDLIPSGRHWAKVTDGEIRESGPNAKHPGAEYINWEFTLQEGDFEGRKQWTITSIGHGDCTCDDWDQGNAMINLKRFLYATGLFTKEQLDSDKFDFEIDEVIGADVDLVIRTRVYEGEEQNDVKSVKQHGAAADTSLLPG